MRHAADESIEKPARGLFKTECQAGVDYAGISCEIERKAEVGARRPRKFEGGKLDFKIDIHAIFVSIAEGAAIMSQYPSGYFPVPAGLGIGSLCRGLKAGRQAEKNAQIPGCHAQ